MNLFILLFSWLAGFFIVYWLFTAYRSSKLKPAFGIVHLVVSAVVMFSSFFAYEFLLTYRLAVFDLNGNGVFEMNEQSPEQSEAFEAVTNDSGRKLIQLWGVPMYIVLAVIEYICGLVVRRVRSGG